MQSQRQHPATSSRLALQSPPEHSPPGQSACVQQDAPLLVSPTQRAPPRSHFSPESTMVSPQLGRRQLARQWSGAFPFAAPSSHSSSISTKPFPHWTQPATQDSAAGQSPAVRQRSATLSEQCGEVTTAVQSGRQTRLPPAENPSDWQVLPPRFGGDCSPPTIRRCCSRPPAVPGRWAASWGVCLRNLRCGCSEHSIVTCCRWSPCRKLDRKQLELP